MKEKPHFFSKLVFWILIGLLSTFFAEVLSGSAPNFLMTAFGYWGIFPIYCLHTLFLASLIMTRKRPFSLRTLFLTSLLFGMYEAYITKVLWKPSWNPATFAIAEIAVAETLLLVFYWHAIFSFLIPLFVGENLLADSNHIMCLLPKQWQERILKPRIIALFGLYSSLLLAAAATSVEDSFGLSFFNCLVLTILILIWRVFTRRKHYDLIELLPSGKGLIPFILLLALIYLIFGFNLSLDALPGPIGHIAILVMYILFIVLIRRSAKKDLIELPPLVAMDGEREERFGLKEWLLFCVMFIAGSILVNLLPDAIQELLTGMVFISGIGLGIWFFALSLRDLFGKRNLDNVSGSGA